MRDKMRIVDILKRVILSISFICFVSLTAIAADNNLSGVEVSNINGDYYIVFKADQPTEVRKTIQSSNEIVLSLKNISPIDSVPTIYNNVPDVDSVLIMPEVNDIRIIVKGKNISNASISFSSGEASIVPKKTEASEATEASSNELELNGPVSAYAPVYPEGETTLYDKDNFDIKELAGSALAFSPMLKKCVKKAYNYAENLGGGYLIMGVIFMLVMFFGFKALISGKKDDDIAVGLSQSLRDREVNMKDQFNLSNELQTLRVQNPNTTRSLPSMNYSGLKAYQASQKNPYTSQHSNMPVKPTMPQVKKPLPHAVPVQRPVAPTMSQTKPTFNQPQAVQRASNPVAGNIPQAMPRQQAAPSGQSIDSIKFLESMAQIYERSGRADLAQGLKTNIQKVHSMK